MTQQPEHRTGGPLPGGEPDDVAEQSTPGSDGDGPEAGYDDPAPDADGEGDDADGARSR